jgi:GntR family transcriptional regulator, transcriptional repressor for pyruvate dehydrogenase complex
VTTGLGKLRRGPHLSTLVASSITREIAQGRLRPGAQLPTEQALATTFGVSRNVVREAIARFRSEGRVWSQQGRGAFVSDVPQASILKIEHDHERPADAFMALFQFRGIMEVQAAALAARLHAEQDLERLARAQRAMGRALYGSVDWLKGDLEFHSAIARATGNTYVVQVMGFVSERMRESILAAGNEHSDDMAQVTEREHGAIYEAVAARDEAGASEAMRRHLANAERRVGARAANNGEAEQA